MSPAEFARQSTWVDICVGRNSNALVPARHMVALIRTSKDALTGESTLTNLAEIEAQTGDADEAINTISELFAMPAGLLMTIERLKLDPIFDRLRKDPRFQNLLTERQAAPKVAMWP